MIQKISNWDELSKCKSETHYLDINTSRFNGWIRSKCNDGYDMYLSTHTFYEGTHLQSTSLLQKFGFNVELVSHG